MHQHIKVIHHSENILVTFDWHSSMNELMSSDIKVRDCSKSVNHVFSFSQSHKCGRFVTFCNVLLGPGCDSCCHQCVRLVAALLFPGRYLWCEHLSTGVTVVWNNTRHSSWTYQTGIYVRWCISHFRGASWFGNGYHNINYVCSIGINILSTDFN